MELAREVRSFLEERGIGEKDCLLLALSGGRDSLCLFHVLVELRPLMGYRLRAMYVHHGLRREADEEAAWLRRCCLAQEVPFTVAYVNVGERVEQTKESVEEAARALRYRALEEEGRKQDAWILTAHHAQDQAETVLLRLLRGSGLRGLGGMTAQRGRLLRPLLGVEPARIAKYMEEREICWRQDASNEDLRYTRNWVRHRLIPLLEEKNPAVQRSLRELADQARQDEEYMEQEAEAVFREAYDGEGLSIPILKKAPAALQGRVLFCFLRQKGGTRNVGRVHIQMLREICRGPQGGEGTAPGGRVFYRSYDRLLMRKKEDRALPQAGVELAWDGLWHDTPWGRFRVRKMENPFQNFQQIPDLPYTKWVNCDTITEQLVARTRRQGDYLGVGGGHQSLKKYMVNAKIPREERDRMAVLACGSHVLWVVGKRLSEEARLTQHVTQVVCIEYDPKKEEENNCWNPKETE